MMMSVFRDLENSVGSLLKKKKRTLCIIIVITRLWDNLYTKLRYLMQVFRLECQIEGYMVEQVAEAEHIYSLCSKIHRLRVSVYVQSTKIDRAFESFLVNI